MTGKVLVVEDEADIREAMAEAIAEDGFTVSTAENGQEGLEKALAEHPDLILLDLKMPIMDGQQVLEKLRADPWGSNCKVIVMTAMDDVDNVASAHQNRLEDYLIKTYTTLDTLVRKVRVTLA